MENHKDNEMQTGLYRDPSVQIIPTTLGPKVCKPHLHLAIGIPSGRGLEPLGVRCEATQVGLGFRFKRTQDSATSTAPCSPPLLPQRHDVDGCLRAGNCCISCYCKCFSIWDRSKKPLQPENACSNYSRVLE